MQAPLLLAGDIRFLWSSELCENPMLVQRIVESSTYTPSPCRRSAIQVQYTTITRELSMEGKAMQAKASKGNANWTSTRNSISDDER